MQDKQIPGRAYEHACNFRQAVLRTSIIAAPLTEADMDRLADAVLAAWRRVS